MPGLEEIVLKMVRSFARDYVRYTIFAGSLYFIFYVWKRRELFRFKIQQKFPKNKDIWREVGYSTLSMFVFVNVGTLIFIFHEHTRIYKDFNAHSVPYFIFSVVLFIFAHDAYFYVTHRLMHWKKIYPYVHKVHHLSVNPTPWAAFAFHPLEALVEVGILPLMVFTVPLHPLAILAWVLFMLGYNVMGHLGFEVFPDGFASHSIWKWHNTSTHHNMHHKKVTCNYGLYFNIWDRLLGTNHAQYEQEFDMVRERAKNTGTTDPEPSTEAAEATF